MLLRRLGHSGLEVSRLGLGTMQWGEAVDEIDAQQMLSGFLDAGGTLLDVSPSYSEGAAEPLVGELLQKLSCRDDVVLAGKAGLRRTHDGPRRDTSRRTLLDQLDRSLADLGTDRLDLWQVHVWDDATPLEETLSALEHAWRTGRARYVGVCNHNAWQTAVAHAGLAALGVPLTGVQVEYSLLRRDLEGDLLDAVRHLGTGVVAWSPLGRGVLAGRYRASLPAASRAASPVMASFVERYLTPRHAAVVEAVARAAEGLELSPAQVSLAWLRDRPGVGSLLLGARTPDQLTHDLLSEDVHVPAEILTALDDVSASLTTTGAP